MAWPSVAFAARPVPTSAKGAQRGRPAVFVHSPGTAPVCPHSTVCDVCASAPVCVGASVPSPRHVPAGGLTPQGLRPSLWGMGTPAGPPTLAEGDR